MSDDLIHSMWFGLLEPHFDNAYNEHHKGPWLVLSKHNDYPSYNIVNLGTMNRMFMRVEKNGCCHAGTSFTGSIELERIG